MHIAICDSNSDDCEQIKELLQQYFSNKSLKFDLSFYKDGNNLIDDIEEGLWFDLIFLDTYTENPTNQNKTGMEIAHRLRDLEYNGSIVFLTSSTSSELAIQGYDVDATGYLLKPHNAEKLWQTVDRVLKKMNIGTYCIRYRSSIIRIPYSEILYVESSNSKCILHRIDKSTYTIYKRLDEIEIELKDKCFLRCHQSYLVNMCHVQKADKQFIMTTGDTVLIRQRELKNIKETYFKYVEKVINKK